MDGGAGLAGRWARLDPGALRPELVPVPPLERRDAWDSVDAVTARAIVAEADADRCEPWPHPRLSEYARYWRDGVRTVYETPAGTLRRRTSTAVLAAAITGELVYVDEAADGLQFLCEQSTWCWAAHEVFAAHQGRVVPDPDRPFLDLGAAQTVEVLAWADLVLAGALDERVPGLRHRLRLEARRRVIEPFLTSREWHWLGLDGHLHNWNPWIHGHILAAALFLTPEAEVVDLVVDGLARYLDALPADGGCDEGFGYWWNGPARLFEALQLLDWATGGALAPWDLGTELARYPQRVALGEGWYVNVGDGPARAAPDLPWHVPHRWGRAIGDRDVMAHAASHRGPGLPVVHPNAGLSRCLIGLHDAEWGASKAEPPLPARSWLPDVQLLVCRERGGSSEGLAVAVKGGHNDENHNHNDVGSYIVALDGTPVLIDLGQPTYTAISFTARRYEQWVTQSQWHNVPVVNGFEQSPGAFAARDVRADDDGLALDLAGAYPDPAGCRSWRRRVSLDRAAPAVVVSDEWSAPGEVRLHHVLAGEPVVEGERAVVVRTLASGRLRLSWAAGESRLERHPVDDPILRDAWGPAVHRLVITPPAGAGSFELRIARDG